jgi:hypothetical protein
MKIIWEILNNYSNLNKIFHQIIISLVRINKSKILKEMLSKICSLQELTLINHLKSHPEILKHKKIPPIKFLLLIILKNKKIILKHKPASIILFKYSPKYHRHLLLIPPKKAIFNLLTLNINLQKIPPQLKIINLIFSILNKIDFLNKNKGSKI